MEHPGIDMGPMGIFLSGDVKQQDLGCSKSKVAPFSSIQDTTLESLGESRLVGLLFVPCLFPSPVVPKGSSIAATLSTTFKHVDSRLLSQTG